MSARLATVPDKGMRSPPKQHGRCFRPSAVLITETSPIRRSSGVCYPTLPGRERNARVARRWRIVLAIACVVFWRLAVRILAIVAVFLLITGLAVVIQYLHHMAK
jgi:hypothetical protein